MPLPTPLTTSIIHQIADAINRHLVFDMKDAVDSADETRAGLVRLGLLQQSPLAAGINVLTYFNDPEDETGWRHAVIKANPTSSLGIDVPAYQIGGGEFWFRRYKTQLTQFFRVGTVRARAEELSSIILSRAEQSIKLTPLPSDADSFGEVALQTYIHSSVNIEGGGEGQFIYYGTIWYQVLCEKTNTF